MKKNVLIRERVIDTIRGFFKQRGFREVFTPILVPTPSTEPNLEVFRSELITASGLRRKAFLIMSPEYFIKKLMAAGVGSCFEITRCFRNEEEVSRLHNPEFTMLEWYRVGATYQDIMKDFEKLFLKIIRKPKFVYQDITYNISLPWPRISVAEAFKKCAGKDLIQVQDEDFYKIFFNEVEPKLAKMRKPYFLYDYPISQAASARPKPEDPRFAERFEVFLAGIELGNCFSELTDPVEQEKRLRQDLAFRQVQGKTKYGIDKEFIKALQAGLPASAGIAVGVDRLIMLAGDFADIGQTLLFPAKELFAL